MRALSRYGGSFLFAVLFLASCLSAESQERSNRLDADAVFAPRRIVEISIEMKAEDWKSLCGQTRDLLKAFDQAVDEEAFSYFPADITIDGKKVLNVGVRKKGFLGSLDSVRPSLKVKFDEFEERQVAEGFDRLTLNNNKQDPSRLCQYLSYKFFNDAGHVAPRCNFAKVTVNGTSLGIYSNVESIDKPFLQDRFGDSRGPLYEGTAIDFLPGYVERLESKNKAARHQEVTQLAELMDRDILSLADVEQLLDVEAFVRYWAIESLLGFWDGYSQNQNNYFVYQVPQTQKLQFIPWGMDSAFTDVIPLPQLKSAHKSIYVNSVLANRLYRDPRIQELYAKTMRQLLVEHWDEAAMLTDVDELAAQLREDSGAETANFDSRVAEIKRFIQGRRAVIEKELEGGPRLIRHGVRRPIAVQRIGTASGSFATQWNERTPNAATKQGTARLQIELQGKEIEFKELGVTAEPSQDRNAREADGTMPPTIAFHGIRKSDQKSWLLVVSTSSVAFRPSAEPAQVAGIVIEGNPVWFFAKMLIGGFDMEQFILVSGTATFDQASREVGAPVSGRLSVNVGKFDGGDYLPIR